MHWMRRNSACREAGQRAQRAVLPTPGTSSISTCPRASSAATTVSTAARLPKRTALDVFDELEEDGGRHAAAILTIQSSKRTYSYSKGRPLMPRAGLAIQLAIWPGSRTAFWRFAT